MNSKRDTPQQTGAAPRAAGAAGPAGPRYWRGGLGLSLLTGLLTSLMLGLSACGTPTAAPSMFDFGALAPTHHIDKAPLALALAEVQAPVWLEGSAMFYRLSYENAQQPRPYAGSRWAMSPAQLLDQRLRARLAQNGTMVVNLGDGAANLPVLRVESDDFTQHFSSPNESSAKVHLRVSLFQNRSLVAQTSIATQAPAPSANAAGGAAAMARASDEAIELTIQWLSTLPLKK